MQEIDYKTLGRIDQQFFAELKRESLTDVQSRAYNYILQEILVDDHTPTIRELITALGYKSPAPVQNAIALLKEKKYLAKHSAKARGIRVVGLPTKLELMQMIFDLQDKLSEIEQAKPTEKLPILSHGEAA